MVVNSTESKQKNLQKKKALIGDKFITKTRSSTSVKNYNTMLPNPKYKGGGPFLIHWRKSSRG